MKFVVAVYVPTNSTKKLLPVASSEAGCFGKRVSGRKRLLSFTLTIISILLLFV